MAWNNPRTWIAGEFVTALLMNEQLRDNLNILKTNINNTGAPSGALLASLQSADITKNANTTLEDLDDLAFPIAANETWGFGAVSFMISDGTADVKYSVTAPAGSTGRFGILGSGAPITAGSTTVFGDPVDMAIPNTLTQTVMVWGSVIASVTPGTVQIQGAQNTSTAVNTIFYQNSIIIAVRKF